MLDQGEGGTYRLSIGAYRWGIGTYRVGIGTYRLGIGAYRLGIGTYCLGIGTYRLGIGTRAPDAPPPPPGVSKQWPGMRSWGQSGCWGPEVYARHAKGCIRRERTSEVAIKAVGQAVTVG